MTMSGIGVPRALEPRSSVFDCLARVTPETAASLAQAGYRGAARYIDGPTPLIPEERDALWAAGLGILPLTVAITQVQLTHILGLERADHDLATLAALGVPPGVHVVLDLESTAGLGEEVASYVDGRTSTWEQAGRFVPMLYVGAGQPLQAGALYALPSVHAYWRGGSVGIPEPIVSFCLWQIPPLDQVVSGQRIDHNASGRDNRGRAPLLWWPE